MTASDHSDLFMQGAIKTADSHATNLSEWGTAILKKNRSFKESGIYKKVQISK